MSRVQAKVWGKILIRNKLITQDKWDFLYDEYVAQGASASIGQLLVDAGYINVKQMQQIGQVVDQVLAKSAPEKVTPQQPEPTSTPEPVAEPEPAPSDDDFDGGIDMEPERDEEEKLQITDLDEVRSKVTAEPVSDAPALQSVSRAEVVESDEDSYDLAGPAPTDDDEVTRVSEVDWHVEGDSATDFQIDDSERISLDGDDED